MSYATPIHLLIKAPVTTARVWATGEEKKSTDEKKKSVNAFGKTFGKKG